MAWQDQVHPHTPLTQVVAGLWAVQGSLPRSGLPRTMAVVELEQGLLLHSGIALDDAGLEALEALGPPRILIVPNRMHRTDAAAYKERYPQLQVVAPRAARAAVEEIVPVDAVAEEILPTLGIEPLIPDGLKPSELVYRVPVASGCALLITDLLFNLPHQRGLSGLVLRYLTRSTGGFKVTGLGRVMLVQDRSRLGRWLLQLAEPEPVAIVVAHGDWITTDCAACLRQAASALS
ncbi:MAG TPA: hypothetical protein ENK18_19125 [Deltaproteobacteria bacterium]|nr:hypothetical protein [Deltaproteobacteria bacterium]